MRTTWRVTWVTMTEGRTMADLQRVEWFKPNPAHAAMMAEYDALVEQHGREEADRITEEQEAGEWIEEFLEAEPDEPNAQFNPHDGETLTVDIHDSLDLVPGDNVAVNLDALDRAST